MIKIHQMVRKDDERKGKLVPKAEGHYLVSECTDECKNIAVIEDANGAKWTKRVADLSLWEWTTPHYGKCHTGIGDNVQ